MENNKQLERALEVIKNRNRKVEVDKAWEISLTRRSIVAILTYITIVLFFFVAGLPKPFINSIVPTTGFVLSTLSLSLFKKIWLKNRVAKQKNAKVPAEDH